MSTFIAWGNIHQYYPFDEIPPHLIQEHLRVEPIGAKSNSRLLQRYQCRRLAHFLLWNLIHVAAKTQPIFPEILTKIYRTSSGRPQFCLREDTINIDFNISHSGEWVVVMLNISESKNVVGVDIEFPQKKRDFPALLAHFASPDEQAWFVRQANQEKAFYQVWCLREAILKSQGIGIAKLSEVEHDPILHRLNSVHCPKGQLYFSDELPFYFAAFSSDLAMSNIQCFEWQNAQLNPFNLQSAVKYSVNF